MDRDVLTAEMQAVVDAHGPWNSHNVALPFGVFTMGPEPRGDNYRTVKFLRLVADTLRRPLAELRVLDLASHEGLYSLEFARHGATVVGVEGREANLAKAEFARRALGLENVRFVLADVRQVTVEEYGTFDVILCSGILYHLDHPDVFEFLKNIHAMCKGVCLIDASISLSSDLEVVYEGRSYWGSIYKEHEPDATVEQKMRDVGASLDNNKSFWITKYGLTNFLSEIGFTSVVECLSPVPWMLRKGRVTLVATAGNPISAFNEIGRALEGRRWPPQWGAEAASASSAAPTGPGIDAEEAWALTVRNKFGRWNYDPARFHKSPVDVVHNPKFKIQASDKFFCIGSCFARNIEEHLIYSRIEVLSKRAFSPIEEWSNRPNAFMNKYTIASMLNELRWAIDLPSEISPDLFIETPNGWLDPQLSPAANPTSFDRVVERRRYLATEVFARIRQADIAVITLGLVEAWFDVVAGIWLNGTPPLRTIRAQPGRYRFVSTSVTQNGEWLEHVRLALKTLNPKIRMVVTVSPVPMETTFSGQDSAVAHTVSKARLRVVADEFVERHEDADYFPSFEMVSLAPRASTFAEDNIHVEDATVGGVVRSFVKTFIPDAPEPVSGYHEMTYLRSNPDVYAAVRRGELTSGFEHWIKSQPALA